jgi:hypothetical protein
MYRCAGASAGNSSRIGSFARDLWKTMAGVGEGAGGECSADTVPGIATFTCRVASSENLGHAGASAAHAKSANPKQAPQATSIRAAGCEQQRATSNAVSNSSEL